MKTLTVSDYVEAAVLKAAGTRFLGAEPGGSRVGLVFEDDDGQASVLIEKHENGGVQVNSADLAASLAFVKDKIFSTRRETGRDHAGRDRRGNSFGNR